MKTKGFTLIELLVCLAIGFCILALIFSGDEAESVKQHTGPLDKPATPAELCIEKGGVPITEVLSGGRENLVDCKGI